MTYGAVYQCTNLLQGLTTHSPRAAAYVADVDETPFDSKSYEIESHVRSGDYLSTLATTLTI